jgi:hypothetical protein
MSKKLFVVYVPGLGDQNPNGQRKAVKFWHFWGVNAELCHMNWADSESWDDKLERLLSSIDDASAAGYDVGLVASSAGAGAAVNAFALRKDKIVGCVLIAGKVNSPQTIGGGYRRKNPAFVDSANAVTESLEKLNAYDRSRILSRYAVLDEIVRTKDSRVEGAHNHFVLSIGHFITIATQITFGAPSFLYFLKKQKI